MKFSIFNFQFSIPSLILLCFCAGCSVPRPLHGGKSITAPHPAGGLTQTLAQSDNPSQPSRQSQDFVRTRTYTVPAANIGPIPSYPSHLTPPTTAPEPQANQKSKIKNQNSPSIEVLDREESHATTELGAAQKDTAREFAAKLSSLKSITWAGVVLFVFGLVSLFWPPLRTLIGSLTTSAALIAGGLALVILPTLIVGHELLILGAVALSVAGWFLAHRHGHARGQLHALTQPKPPAKRDAGAVLI